MRSVAYTCAWVSIPSRGFWFFEGQPHRDSTILPPKVVSIPSRGFWFFEGVTYEITVPDERLSVSIPSRGFWFFEGIKWCTWYPITDAARRFQSPRGDFGFLKYLYCLTIRVLQVILVSIPSRGFWFFEDMTDEVSVVFGNLMFQSPRGDFGFLKGEIQEAFITWDISVGFNPLAGILVF